MSSKIAEARHKLRTKLAQVKADREQQELLKKNKGSCNHEWQMFKESIEIDYSVEAFDGEPRVYSGPAGPYFIVKACPKCKSKWYLDIKYRDGVRSL